MTTTDYLEALRWAGAEARSRAILADHRQCPGLEATASDHPHPCQCQNPDTAATLEAERQLWESRAAVFALLATDANKSNAAQTRYTGNDWVQRLLDSKDIVRVYDIIWAGTEFGYNSPLTIQLSERWGLQRNR